MSKYIGDFAEDAVFNCKFSTVNLSQVPTTLAGSPVIKCYKAGATGTETATGITLTVDFDSVTGLNNIAVDLSSDAFYATGNNYSLVITTGTVDSISVVGCVVKEFSIENRFVRGTDSAFLAASAPANFSSLGIEADGDLTKVNLCATTTTNTDMLTVADVLTTQMTEAYAADGTAPTLAQAIFLIQQSLHEFAIVDTTRTVKKLDGSTSAATFTLDDASSPTSTTRAS